MSIINFDRDAYHIRPDAGRFQAFLGPNTSSSANFNPNIRANAVIGDAATGTFSESEHNLTLVADQHRSVALAFDQPSVGDTGVYRVKGTAGVQHVNNTFIQFFYGIAPATINTGDTAGNAMTFPQVLRAGLRNLEIDDLFFIPNAGTISSTDYSSRMICFGYSFITQSPVSSSADAHFHAQLSFQNLKKPVPRYSDTVR